MIGRLPGILSFYDFFPGLGGRLPFTLGRLTRIIDWLSGIIGQLPGILGWILGICCQLLNCLLADSYKLHIQKRLTSIN